MKLISMLALENTGNTKTTLANYPCLARAFPEKSEAVS
jgi:hypothetical protein